MRRRSTTTVLFLGLAVTAAWSTKAQQEEPRGLYIIFDGSNSMWGELPDASRKIEVAKDVFNRLDAAQFEGRDIALRLYGHRREGDCADIELAVPFGSAETALGRVADRINGVTPRGKTPITRSLTAALEDFGDRAGDILLISDGIETCDADPCDLVRSWRENDVQVRVHVVGLGLTDVAKGAMQCIAEASGTVYRDANSAVDLAGAIEQTARSDAPEPGIPDPAPQRPAAEFRLAGRDDDGSYLPVRGTLTDNADRAEDVSSNRRYVFEAGTYTLRAGVPTANGEIYEPVTRQVEVNAEGETLVTVNVPRPPRVTTRFLEQGEEIRGPVAKAYRDDVELFGLRPNEEQFILPGTYEFRARLDQDNDLAITETIAPGEDKTLVFEAAKTVRAVFVARPEGSDTGLRQHQELLRDGEVIYKVHYANGADIRPGVYTIRSQHELSPYEIEGVEVSTEEMQTIELIVPLGRATARYQFKGTPPTNDMRCWFVRIDESGQEVASSRALGCDGREIVLAAGRYRVRPWSRLGEFSETEFSVTPGTLTEVQIPER